MSQILQVDNLTMRFGGLTAIGDLSFTAPAQQVTSIIGPNGAGKTTLSRVRLARGRSSGRPDDSHA